MGMPASHLDSLTAIAAPDASGGAPPRPKASPPPDPQAAQFRKLFARVFGEQVRQEPADRSVNSSAGRSSATENPEPLRSLQIGRSTQIITAGPPLAEEDLVRFAREAELDEASIAALLASQSEHASHAGEALEPSEPSDPSDPSELSQATPIGPWVTGQFDTPLSLPLGLTTARLIAGGFAQDAAPSGATGQASPFPSSQSSAPSAAAALAAQGASPAAASGASAFTVSVSVGSESLAGQPPPTNAWMLSRANGSEGVQASEVTELDASASDPESSSVEGTVKDGSAKDVISEKALALKLAFRDSSAKDRLMKLLGPEALRAAQASQPQGVRLEAIALFEQSVAPAGTDLNSPSSPPPGLSSAAGAASAATLGSGMGSGGQGTGSEGGRPDANAQAGQGRGLPQQVMQRFGELLGQRLLQQVSQGNWRVELDLEPGDLGSIRIELELRKGEIEASIKASQAGTRELLQESLPRLRETLERNGMDVASLSVGQQDRRQSDGQSSSGRNGSSQRALAEDSSAEAALGPSPASKPDDGRLDVWA